MREQDEPMTKIMNASEVKEQWNSVINGVYKGHTRILVEKSGIPVAGVVSAGDLERLQRLVEEQAADQSTHVGQSGLRVERLHSGDVIGRQRALERHNRIHHCARKS